MRFLPTNPNDINQKTKLEINSPNTRPTAGFTIPPGKKMGSF